MNNSCDQISGFSHVSFYVNDLIRSTNFYVQFLGFKVVERPNFDFDGIWLKNLNRVEIHLISGKKGEFIDSFGIRKNHIAFHVKNLQFWLLKAKELNIEYIGPKKRPDGIDQIFVKDPDGYWIELTNG